MGSKTGTVNANIMKKKLIICYILMTIMMIGSLIFLFKKREQDYQSVIDNITIQRDSLSLEVYRGKERMNVLKKNHTAIERNLEGNLYDIKNIKLVTNAKLLNITDTANIWVRFGAIH